MEMNKSNIISELLNKKVQELINKETEEIFKTQEHSYTSDSNNFTKEKLDNIAAQLNSSNMTTSSVSDSSIDNITTSNMYYPYSPTTGANPNVVTPLTTVPYTYYPSNPYTLSPAISPSVWTTGSITVSDPNAIKIKKLEKQLDLLLKFMVSKGLIEDEKEFSDFLEAVDVMEELGGDSSEEKT